MSVCTIQTSIPLVHKAGYAVLVAANGPITRAKVWVIKMTKQSFGVNVANNYVKLLYWTGKTEQYAFICF